MAIYYYLLQKDDVCVLTTSTHYRRSAEADGFVLLKRICGFDLWWEKSRYDNVGNAKKFIRNAGFIYPEGRADLRLPLVK